MNLFRRKTPEQKAAEEAEKAARLAAEKAQAELEAERARRIHDAKAAIQRYRLKVAPKWEYYTLAVYRPDFKKAELRIAYDGKEYDIGKLLKIIDELGAYGWEMVGVLANTDWNKYVPATFAVTYTSFAHIYFKRPLTELPDELKQLLNAAESYGR